MLCSGMAKIFGLVGDEFALKTWCSPWSSAFPTASIKSISSQSKLYSRHEAWSIVHFDISILEIFLLVMRPVHDARAWQIIALAFFDSSLNGRFGERHFVPTMAAI